MRARSRKLVSFVLVAGVLVAGCSYAQTHRKTVTGAGIGAAAGAIGGGLYKGRKGMLWGAAIGAVLGAAIGAYEDHQDKSAQQTYEDYGYTPGAGTTQLTIEGVSADPAAVAPGGTVNLGVTYAVLTPGANDVVRVTETRKVTLNGQELMAEPHEVLRPAGTFTSTLPLQLPNDAQAGTYVVLTTLQGAGQSSSQTTTFTVQ